MKIKRALIEEAEKELDSANYLFGTKNQLCIYCSANLYDGQKGVIHKDNCILFKIRRRLAVFQKPTQDKGDKRGL